MTKQQEAHAGQLSSGSDFRPALVVQIRVIGALILRDVRARMGGSLVNYFRFVITPLTHLLTLAGLAAFTGRAAPLGTDNMVFFVSGVLPFVLFLYPIRSNVHVLDENRPLLVFPIINPIDVVLARVLLEAINSFLIILILALILYIAGYDVLPKDPFKTLCGILATVSFSVAFCIPNAVTARLVFNWQQACVLTAIGLYMMSGAFFLPSQVPDTLREAMYFNPLAHCVEWIRSGYYETYNEGLLDKRYLLAMTLIFATGGLAMERFLRGRLN